MEETLKKKREELDRQIKELYEARMKLREALSGSYSDDYTSLIEGAIENTPATFPEVASVVCQGVAGAYSQRAAEKLFKSPDITFVKNFDDVFEAIESGKAEYGVLPIENSTAGSVNKTYDLMKDHRFYIVRSTRVKVEHNLMAKRGVKKADITDVYSHPQALAQCENYLQNMEAAIHESTNTAAAAKAVAEAENMTSAAICSSRCAELYGLNPIETNIQDHGSNFTRFICISKVPEIFPGADKTSIMATISHKPGMLFETIKTFNDKGFNLVKLESRPIPDTDFQFMFYFDFEASVYHKDYIKALNEVSALCESMEYLGSYNEKV